MNNDDKYDNAIKNAVQEFFDNMAGHYYKGSNKVSKSGHIYSGKTALLNWLKVAFNTVQKVDDESKKYIEKTILKPLSNPVKIFARVRVEEFFYAQLISNLFSNLLDIDNMKKYGYTQQQILLIRNTWSELINKANSIINFEIKAKFNEVLLTRDEYYKFAFEISKTSSEIRKIVKEFEKFVSLRECEEFLDYQLKEYMGRNPILNTDNNK